MLLKKQFHDRHLAQPLVREIHRLADRVCGAKGIGDEIRIMEVCGTHTVALRRSGIHSLLPPTLRMISGPGCPVCVTPTGYLDNALTLVEGGEVTVASFGDMLKVPGSRGYSLSRYQGSGRVRLVYSPLELLSIAQAASGPVVFLGIGFETTIPAVAAAFLQTWEQEIDNLYLYPAFKTIPLALQVLLESPDRSFHGLLLPGHVSVILGVEPYRVLETEGGVPGVITGFEPLDMLHGILSVLRQLAAGERRVENAYPRAVREGGNPRARAVMERLLVPGDALWRGLGVLPGSGMQLREEFARFDASARFGIGEIRNSEPPGCLCSQVIQGKVLPRECSLFGTGCTPEQPVGPCMVSTEGICAAHYRYGEVPL